MFGSIKSLPISKEDLRKLIPMTLMLFLISLNYSLLRTLKDSVVITAYSSGAEVIPFIKLWFMLPMAFLFTVAFTKLSNRFSQEKVTYITISTFLIFYAVFAFILYPMRDTLHLNGFADTLQSTLPAGFKGLIAAFRNWTLTFFYVMSELWGSIVLSVLFWGFANEVTKISEARYFYSVFGIGSNISAIIAGQVGVLFSRREFNPSIPFGKDAWEQSLIEMVIFTLILGVLVMVIFWWMNRNVLNDPTFEELHKSTKPLKIKKKLSVRESFSYLKNSKYLLYIATLVLAYNLVIHLVEVVWKDQLRVLYPEPADYNAYMNHLTSMIGIISTITAIFMPKIIRYCGWTWTALMTPLTMLVTSIGFFVFFFWREHLGAMAMAYLGMTPIAIAVFFGSAQNCLSKAAKYSVFDTTKEMTFIPLPHDVKLKGKAAIDGFGSRLGKSGGSVIHQVLLMFFVTLTASAPYVAAVLMAVIFMWISATKALGKEFQLLTHGQEVADKHETEEAESSPQPVTT